MRVLLIEDDAHTAAFIGKAMKEDGHVVDSTDNGKEGLYLASTETYDVLVIDRMLPGLDGLTLLRTLRGAGNATPAILLTALADVDHRVEGLRAGADDYLAKPFAYAELSARVESVLRRGLGGAEGPATMLKVADLELDLLSRRASRSGRRIDLQPREFRLLEYLMRQAGRVVTRTMLLEAVWDYHFDPQTNVIDVHISRLRQKIDQDGEPLLQTVRGAGYRLAG